MPWQKSTLTYSKLYRIVASRIGKISEACSRRRINGNNSFKHCCAFLNFGYTYHNIMNWPLEWPNHSNFLFKRTQYKRTKLCSSFHSAAETFLFCFVFSYIQKVSLMVHLGWQLIIILLLTALRTWEIDH